MFHVRDRRTGSLFDPWAYLGPKRRKLLDRSWAGLFRKEILPHLPVEAITAAFWSMVRRWFIASTPGWPRWPLLATRTI